MDSKIVKSAEAFCIGYATGAGIAKGYRDYIK